MVNGPQQAALSQVSSGEMLAPVAPGNAGGVVSAPAPVVNVESTTCSGKMQSFASHWRS